MDSAEHPHHKLRRNSRKRMIWASVTAVALVALFVILGPSRESIKRKFEFSGAEGPLLIMPELSIDDGSESRYQDQLAAPSDIPSAPEYEIADENSMKAELPLATPRNPETKEVEDPNKDPDLDITNAVEMLMPAQMNPYFRLLRMVRPRYPAEATPEDRDKRNIIVEVAFFVSSTGDVSGSYIISCSGSQAFREITLKAVDQWIYEPLIVAGETPDGFWNHLTINFHSPRS